MVKIKNLKRRDPSLMSLDIHQRFRRLHQSIVCVIVGLLIVWALMVFELFHQTAGDASSQEQSSSSPLAHSRDEENTLNKSTTSNTGGSQGTCQSSKFFIKDLTDEQRNPTIGKRWMVRPPSGGNLQLMCCDTTKGSFHVLLHERWAPIGNEHILKMFDGGYFDVDIPLFRCTDACQFGLSSNATLTKKFGKSIPDDPLWLPTGPENRFSSGADGKEKIKRYPKGVLTHAGGGKNSRGVQFVLTLKPNKFMGGGSPWEVPLGEVVEVQTEDPTSDHKFIDVSLPDIYTGYGEKGPGQGLLHRQGASESVREKWPLMDYVLRCSITDRFFEDGDRVDKIE